MLDSLCVTPPVLECRYQFATAVCDVAVHTDGHAVADAPFRAVAYVVNTSERALVVNTRGMPLVAFGPSPEKAANYLASALRRRYDGPRDAAPQSHGP